MIQDDQHRLAGGNPTGRADSTTLTQTHTPTLCWHSLPSSTSSSPKANVWACDKSWPIGHKGMFWRDIQKIPQIKKDSLKQISLPLQCNLVVSICDLWNHHTQVVATRKQPLMQAQYAKVGGEKDGRSLGPQCQLLDQSFNCLTHFSSYVK